MHICTTESLCVGGIMRRFNTRDNAIVLILTKKQGLALQRLLANTDKKTNPVCSVEHQLEDEIDWIGWPKKSAQK